MIQRTIRTILNLETGEQLDVNHLLRNPKTREADIFILRTAIEKQIRTKTPTLVCSYCKQPIGIRGHYNKKDFFLNHTQNSDDCLYKTENQLTEAEIRCIQYNGEKESLLHSILKYEIAAGLSQDEKVRDVRVEKIYREEAISRDWKKPDVMADFGGHRIAFELQLSTTFLSVIVDRTMFYQERNVFLIWIFPHFSLDSDLQRFTQKDVYYNNSFNVYVFDKAARQKTLEERHLVLTCYYKQFYIRGEQLYEQWQHAFVKLSDLTFNAIDSTVHYYDSVTEKNRLNKELEKLQSERLVQENLAYSKQKVKRAIEYLRDVYKHDQLPWPPAENPSLDEIETAEDIKLLNSELAFNGSKAILISELFENGNKPNFLKLICLTDHIHVDTSQLIIQGNTVFQHIAWINEQHNFYRYIVLLFRKGYLLTEKDTAVWERLYDTNYFNTTTYEIEMIERWAFIHALKSVWHNEDVTELMKIRKLVFALTSLKHDVCVGYRYKNLRQLTMKVLESSPGDVEMYIKGMKAFSRYEQQLKEDKSGKLKLKLDQFYKEKPEQTTTDRHLIYQIFPEIEFITL